MAGEYSSFRDPFGLVYRMLRSGDAAARTSLVLAAARPFMAPVDAWLSKREAGLYEQAAGDADSAVSLHVVGPPRSGTTLAYQYFSRALPVSYCNNLSSLFPRSPLASMAMLNKYLRPPPGDIKNFYGNTAGLASPNDAHVIWNRWLGSHRYKPTDNLAEPEATAMRRFFSAAAQVGGRPFLTKANRNAACVPMLAEAMPGAHFVWIRREPVYVAQSLLVARRQVQGTDEIGWGLASRDADDTDSRDPVDAVCAQVAELETMLEQAVAGTPSERLAVLAYEDLCRDPFQAARAVAELAGLDVGRANAPLLPTEFSATNRVTVSAEEFGRLREGLQTRGVDPGRAA